MIQYVINNLRLRLTEFLVGKSNSTPFDALPIGTQVGPDHHIIGYLGSGGFGYTYLARNNQGNAVALKECFPFEFCRRNGLDVGLKTHDQRDAFEMIQKRFVEEGTILAEFDHPNIVGGGALISAFETVYIEMDQVQGTLLSDKIDSWFGGVSSKQCEDMGGVILSALQHMHEKGYLHKDISPDNIILTREGAPILIDFGSAAPLDAKPVDDPMLVVKIGYSPQEFYRPGSTSGEASDLYQLAATLRHCLTGHRPVESVSRLHACAQGKPDPLSPLSNQGRASSLFLETIDQSMSVFIKDRIKTAEEWLQLLKGVK
jgi:serine/threonine protein kinase